MNTDNPFGMEMDEDGLPEYSPDRKNMTAYHMVRPGLTDKLPDPEKTHTPFFRTPSYDEEKAERERKKEAGSIPEIEAEPVKPERPDFFKHTPVEPDSPSARLTPSVRQEFMTPPSGAQNGQGNFPDTPASGTGMSGPHAKNRIRIL